MAKRLRALTPLQEVLSSKTQQPHGSSQPSIVTYDTLFWCLKTATMYLHIINKFLKEREICFSLKINDALRIKMGEYPHSIIFLYTTFSFIFFSEIQYRRSQNSHPISSLQPRVTYVLWMTAVTAAGESPQGNEREFCPQGKKLKTASPLWALT